MEGRSNNYLVGVSGMQQNRSGCIFSENENCYLHREKNQVHAKIMI